MFLTPDSYIETIFKPWIFSKQPCLFTYPKTTSRYKKISHEHFKSSGSEIFLLPVELNFALKPSFHIPGGQWNVDGRCRRESLFLSLSFFCVCSNIVTALRGQENASLASCLFNSVCHTFILFSSKLYLIFIFAGTSNKCLGGTSWRGFDTNRNHWK